MHRLPSDKELDVCRVLQAALQVFGLPATIPGLIALPETWLGPPHLSKGSNSGHFCPRNPSTAA